MTLQPEHVYMSCQSEAVDFTYLSEPAHSVISASVSYVPLTAVDLTFSHL